MATANAADPWVSPAVEQAVRTWDLGPGTWDLGVVVVVVVVAVVVVVGVVVAGAMNRREQAGTAANSHQQPNQHRHMSPTRVPPQTPPLNNILRPGTWFLRPGTWFLVPGS